MRFSMLRDHAETIRIPNSKSPPAELKDFTIDRILGQGAYGKVFKVTHQQTGVSYAMKCIKKDKVLKSDSMKNLEIEKDILLHVDHPFIVSMKYIFQN